MASGPHFDKDRGTYRVQYFDGYRWRRPTVHRIAGWKKGSPEPKKVPPEAQAAVKVYADRERAARANRPIDPGLTAADFLAMYRATYAREKAAESLVQIDFAIRGFLGWCASRKLSRLDEITTAACQNFLDWRAGQISRKTGKPIAPVRIGQERALLSGAWARPVRLGELAANPWKPTTTPGWAKDRKQRKERAAWTVDQFGKLLPQCRPWLRDVLTLGTQTGLRVSALCGLEWRDIRWAKPDAKGLGEVVVRPEMDKAGRGYSVPMSKPAHDLLARLDAIRDDGPLVLRSARGVAALPGTAAQAIRRACKAAGLPNPKSPNHHMRRTFGRWAVLGHLTGKPVPMFVVMKWLGHANISTTQIYLDLVDDDSQDWMAGD